MKVSLLVEDATLYINVHVAPAPPTAPRIVLFDPRLSYFTMWTLDSLPDHVLVSMSHA